MRDFDWRPLGEICKFIDYRGKTPKKTKKGIPLITAKIIKNGFIEKFEEFIAEEDYESWMRRGIPEYGAVVFTTEAPLGEVAQIKSSEKVALAQRVITMMGIDQLLDNNYLKYALKFPPVKSDIQGRASGTTVQGIKSSELKKVKIPLPEYEVQVKIGEILGSLDDKIELNRRMNETLEQMAMALYKHWFVDFEPFQDKTEDGIPIGWTSGYLGEISDIIMGQSPKSSYYNNVGEGLPFHQGVTNFGDRIPKHEVYSSQILKVAKRGDILVSVRAPVGRINIADRDIVIGRGLSAFRHKSNKMSYLFYTLKNIFKEEDSIGSGTVFNSVSKNDLEKIPILIPPNEIIEQFENQVKEIDRLILTNFFEIRSLIETRDYLLPRLLSGEIEVREAQEQVEEVLANA